MPANGRSGKNARSIESRQRLRCVARDCRARTGTGGLVPFENLAGSWMSISHFEPVEEERVRISRSFRDSRADTACDKRSYPPLIAEQVHLSC